MKKETKFSIIVFIVVVLVAYVTLSFVPDEMLEHSTINGSLLSFLGSSVVKAIGMRAVVAVAIALIVTLLIRIVDTEEKNTKKSTKTVKKETKKEAKWGT